jgi:very-short-patch-repair endonuclease
MCDFGGNFHNLCSIENDCKYCFDRSFASHQKAQYMIVEDDITANIIFKHSQMKRNFKCNKCLHVFESVIARIAHIKYPAWCPYCSGSTQRLCDQEDCKFCYNRSFASHQKAQFMIIENNITPRHITISSNRKMSFACNTCSHVFKSAVSEITTKKNPSWCPYCANKKLCGNHNCEVCKAKSFVSCPMHIYLKDKSIDPYTIALRSGKTGYFICPFCNDDYKASYINVSNNSWCSCKFNKTETKLYEFLKETYGEKSTIKQMKFKGLGNRSFDFWLPEFNIIIELDGEQHFRQVWNWKSPEIIQQNDKEKTRFILNSGKSIIRIYQPEVWNDSIDWKALLIKNIKTREEPALICIASLEKLTLYDLYDGEFNDFYPIIPN